MRINPIIALAPLLLVSCSHDNHAIWWTGDVAPEWHNCHAMAGDHAVLDLQEFRSSVVIPFAWGGYRLFVLTKPDSLQPGASFSLPDRRATTILCDLSHGAPGDAVTDLEGTVEIVRRRGSEILVRLDLRDREDYWSFKGKRWFEHQSAPIPREKPSG
jgi:hypothetical protein